MEKVEAKKSKVLKKQKREEKVVIWQLEVRNYHTYHYLEIFNLEF